MRHLRLVDSETDDGFCNGNSWLTHLKIPISLTLWFLPNLLSFTLSFNSVILNRDNVPEENRAAFDCVFRMESVKEAELEFVFGISRWPIPFQQSTGSQTS